MNIAEGIAIIILIVAVLVLVYYYLQSNPKTLENIRSHVPTNGDADINNFFKSDGGSEEEIDIVEDDDNHEGVGKKIKVKLSDIDMSSFNTDMFSKKIDSFLEHKSDELIKEWSLVTTDDLSDLESKFEETTSRVDALDDDFKKFKDSTESKLSEIDKRIEDLENK